MAPVFGGCPKTGSPSLNSLHPVVQGPVALPGETLALEPTEPALKSSTGSLLTAEENGGMDNAGASLADWRHWPQSRGHWVASIPLTFRPAKACSPLGGSRPEIIFFCRALFVQTMRQASRHATLTCGSPKVGPKAAQVSTC